MLSWYSSVDSILAGLTRLVSKLEKVADRKRKESERLSDEATRLSIQSEIAFKEADRADKVMANIRNLIAQ